MLYLLGTHPEIQQRLYQEIKTILGESREITESHIGQMSYLKAVTRETHRYYTESGRCTVIYRDGRCTVIEVVFVLFYLQKLSHK